VNEKQIIAILLGIFAVLFTILGWAAMDAAAYTEVAQGVALYTVLIVFFAIALGLTFAFVRRK
jgi:Zn-dependent protease with chaperone function